VIGNSLLFSREESPSSYRYQEFQNELFSFRKKLESTRKKFSESLIISDNSNFTYQSSSKVPAEQIDEPNEQLTKIVHHVNQSNNDEAISKNYAINGMYIVPFGGYTFCNDLKWKSPLGQEFNINQDSGFIFGVGLGYQWDLFLSSFDFSFSQTKLQSIDLGGPKLSFVGNQNLFNFEYTAGLRFRPSESTFIGLQGHLGCSFQDISVTMANVQNHNDFDLTYALGIGVEFGFLPTESLFIGLGYKFSKLGELEFYSSRFIHSIKLSGSYVF